MHELTLLGSDTSYRTTPGLYASELALTGIAKLNNPAGKKLVNRGEPRMDNIWMIDMSLKKPAKYLIMALTVLSSALSSAQVYRTTDEHGNVKFTDRPRPTAEAKSVNIGSTNTVRAVEIPVEESSTPEEVYVVDEEAFYYTQLKIVSPVNDTIFPNRLVPTPIAIQIAPELKPKHTLHVMINGTEVSSGSSTQLEIPTLNVGTQSVHVEIMADDKILVKSDAVTIHAFQPGGSNRGSSSRP